MSVVLLGSTSGSVTLQEPAVAGSTVIDLPATSGTMAVLPTATSVLPQASGGTGTTTGYYGFKNRIINGGMVIDQRNAGASVTPVSGQYLVDRFQVILTQASKFTAQQNAGSVTPPAGFIKYQGITSSSAYSALAADYFVLRQTIEGLNTADLAWGTASAATVTLSFWVRSSLTGTFGGSLQNDSSNRSYPFTYTISAANTWEQKSVTIAGDTTGTWLTTNAGGISLGFGLGVGSTYSGTAGAWAAGNFLSATGATSVVGTNGATFYITGVQLEKGSTATSFDYRPIGTELQLCQRYYYKNTYAAITLIATLQAYNTTGSAFGQLFNHPVPMRATPTVTTSTAANFSLTNTSSGRLSCSAITISAQLNNIALGDSSSSATTVAGGASVFYSGASGAFIDASAEL